MMVKQILLGLVKTILFFLFFPIVGILNVIDLLRILGGSNHYYNQSLSYLFLDKFGLN